MSPVTLPLVIVLAGSPGAGAPSSPAPATALLPAQTSVPSSNSLTQVADTSFRHDMHEDFSCLDCHTMEVGHGTLLVVDVSDCRSCHHVRERDRGCEACHQAGELDDVVYPRDYTFDLTVLGGPVERRVDFAHALHVSRECAECHVGPGPALGSAVVDCGGCHEEHHRPTASGCMQCHRDPGAPAHTLEVHQTCSGSGCHVDPPFEVPPPTRTGCLWCHEDMRDHEAGEPCTDCHLAADESGEPSRSVLAPAPRLHGDFGARYLHLRP